MTDRQMATRIAVAHFTLHLAIQLQTLLLYIIPRQSAWDAVASTLWRLPWRQGENVIASIAVGLATWAAARHGRIGRWHPGRWLALALFIALGIYLCANQVSFATFGDHFRPSFTEGHSNLSRALTSFLHETTAFFAINLTLLGLFAGWTAIRCWEAGQRADSDDSAFPAPNPRPARHPSSFPDWRHLLLAVYAVICAVTPPGTDTAQVERHPVAILVADLFTASAPAAPPHPAGAAHLDLRPLRFGRFAETPYQTAALASAVARLRDRPALPNILMVVLESVGRWQLLASDSRPDPGFAPVMREISERAVILDSLYTTFPGTVRAHLTMMTGGWTITWGSVFEEMVRDFAGPTLVGELKRAGYQCAAFATSDLEFENMGLLYEDLGFDHLFHTGQATQEWQDYWKLDSWGCRDDVVASLTIEWLDGQRCATRPTFLMFLPNATHHPYSTVAGYPRPASGTDNLARYHNSIAYVDACIAHLLDAMRRHRLDENWLVVIIGDHGEAFAEWHARNTLHKNHLFEENVRTFMIVADPSRLAAPVVSHRPGSHGDVMPTLLGLLGLSIPGAAADRNGGGSAGSGVTLIERSRPSQGEPGDPAPPDPMSPHPGSDEGPASAGEQAATGASGSARANRHWPLYGHDLLVASFTPRLINFHKNAHPELWGLRDGHWKYIARKTGRKLAQLYDLETDPHEQVNLADRYPDRCELYDRLCATWYVETNAGFLARLPEHRLASEVTAMRPEDVTTYGPKILAFGTNDQDAGFKELLRIHPMQRVVAWTQWVSYPKDKTIRYVFVSPSGQRNAVDFTVKADWSRTRVNFPGPLPMAEGTWTCELFDGPHRLIGGRFEVASEAHLIEN